MPSKLSTTPIAAPEACSRLGPAAALFSSEFQLMLASARPGEEGTSQLIEALIASQTDWNHLLELADRHGMVPLLHRCLRPFSASLPEYFRRNQESRARAIAAHNLHLTAELTRVVDALEKSDITAICYKGPTLALAFYGDIALRSFADLDLLIRRADLLRASELLVREGYLRSRCLSKSEERVYFADSCSFGFKHLDTGVLLDLQWNVAARHFSAEPDFEALLASAEYLDFGGTRLRTLAPEDLLIALAIHGAKHGWNRLSWICDLGELLRSAPALDWEGIWWGADHSGVARLLSLALYLSNQLFGTALAPACEERIRRDSELPLLVPRVYQNLLLPPRLEPEIADHLFFMRAREHWRDRLRYGFGVVFRPGLNDCAAVPLPLTLWRLYYLVRPLRLTFKLLRGLAKRPPSPSPPLRGS